MNVHLCDDCGWESKTPDRVAVVFHPCQSSGRRERLDWRTPRQRHDDERQTWATELFGALESAVGDAALLEGDTE